MLFHHDSKPVVVKKKKRVSLLSPPLALLFLFVLVLVMCGPFFSSSSSATSSSPFLMVYALAEDASQPPFSPQSDVATTTNTTNTTNTTDTTNSTTTNTSTMSPPPVTEEDLTRHSATYAELRHVQSHFEGSCSGSREGGGAASANTSTTASTTPVREEDFSDADKTNGAKHEAMKALVNALGERGTSGERVFQLMAAPDQIVRSREEALHAHDCAAEANPRASVFVGSLGPALPQEMTSSSSNGNNHHSSTKVFLLYYWRSHHDYVFFELDDANEKVLVAEWVHAKE